MVVVDVFAFMISANATKETIGFNTSERFARNVT